MNIKVDQEKCIGCGTCASVCPDSFVVEGAKAQYTGTESECVNNAATSCPVQAITVE